MLEVGTTIAFSAQDCCHACRLTEQVISEGISLPQSHHDAYSIAIPWSTR